MNKMLTKIDSFLQKYKIFFMLIGIVAISQPAYFISCFPVTTKLWRALYICSFVIVAYEFLRLSDIDDYLKISIPIGMYVIIIVSTYVNEGEVKSAVYRLWYYAYCLMLVKVYSKDDIKLFLRLFRDIMLLMIFVNLATEIIWPKGLYSSVRINESVEGRYWFLGFKNGIPKHLIIGVTVASLYYQLSHKIRDLIIAVAVGMAALVSVILIKTSSGLIGIGILLILNAIILLSERKYISKLYSFIRMKLLSLFIVIAFLGVVLTHLLLSNPISVAVTGLFKKTITLSNRIYIWDNILKITGSNILGGIGLQSGNTNVKLIGVTENATDAHDFYLEYLWEGGIGCFVLMIAFFMLLIYFLDKYKKSKNIKVLTAGLFTMMVVFITENCNNYFLWVFFGIILFGAEKLAMMDDHPDEKTEVKS